jgi:hypothetical protein
MRRGERGAMEGAAGEISSKFRYERFFVAEIGTIFDGGWVRYASGLAWCVGAGCGRNFFEIPLRASRSVPAARARNAQVEGSGTTETARSPES